MSGRHLSEAELTAGDLVASNLGGRLIRRDGEHGSHDFDVDVDGHIVALEVTAAVDSALASMYAAAFSDHGEFTTLQADWWILLPQDPDLEVKRAIGELKPHLETLEEHGVAEVRSSPKSVITPAVEDPEIADAAEAIFALGVRRATRMENAAEGQAKVLVSTGGGATSNPEQVNTLVTERAQAKAPQLLSTTADERHVFVWIDGTHADAELAIGTLPPPKTVPTLPDGIDVVWAATVGKLWRLRPPSGWEVVR